MTGHKLPWYLEIPLAVAFKAYEAGAKVKKALKPKQKEPPAWWTEGQEACKPDPEEKP